MAEIEAVIFDLGRVMVTIDPTRPRFAALMRAAGVEPAEAFGQAWRLPEVAAHNTGKMSPEEFYQAFRQRCRLGPEWDFASFREAWADLFDPLPGMESLYRETAARWRTGILSDTDPLHWERIRALLPCLESAAATLSFEAGATKPDPAIYRLAAANCGVPPERCFFVDDIEQNVLAARAAGMRAVRFTGAEALGRLLAGAR